MIVSPSLLITDDDRDFRESLVAVFDDRGFDTVLASDGMEACDVVREASIIRVHLFDLPPAIAVGFFMISAMPGGSMSNSRATVAGRSICRTVPSDPAGTSRPMAMKIAPMSGSSGS